MIFGSISQPVEPELLHQLIYFIDLVEVHESVKNDVLALIDSKIIDYIMEKQCYNQNIKRMLKILLANKSNYSKPEIELIFVKYVPVTSPEEFFLDFKNLLSQNLVIFIL